MNKPSFIPSDKHDMKACSILSETTDEEVEPHLHELLEWLQDSNWPVAAHVINRLQRTGSELAPAIIEVLKGEDQTWKYYLLSGLMLRCKPLVRELCMNEVVRIINSPSIEEKFEEVDLVAGEVLVMYKNEPNDKF